MRAIVLYMACALITVSIAGCNRGKVDTKKLVGTWIAQSNSISNNAKPKLLLEATGKFSASNFPKSVACSSLSTRDLIGGSGNWEFESAYSRIILSFNQYTTTGCVTPYGANVFVESEMYKTKILLFPEGVDNPSAAIALGKSKKKAISD